jgi:ribosome biogenesis GTPase
MYDLAILGFGPFFEEQWQRWYGPVGNRQDTLVPARIAAEHRGSYQVWSNAGSGPARLAGKLRHRLQDQGLPAVGDWVALQAPPVPGQMSIIDRLFDRRTAFTRGSAGRLARPQIVAANVDRVFVVCGLDEDFNLNRIERYLARIWSSGADPAVILNKADVCDDVATLVRETERRCPGVAVHVTSALHAGGLVDIRAGMRPGLTAAFVGSSGAGKSTLINALLGEAIMPTAETRARDGRGQHTTTHRQLVLLPQGGLVLDTPGMRELQLVDEEGLGTAFDEIATLSAGCRFADCGHNHEPGCAVKAAVANGTLAIERLDNYQKLQREAQAYERRHDERTRRQSDGICGSLRSEAARLRKWKEGG